MNQDGLVHLIRYPVEHCQRPFTVLGVDADCVPGRKVGSPQAHQQRLGLDICTTQLEDAFG